MGSDDERRGHKSRRSRHEDEDDDRPRRDTKDRESHRRRRSRDRDRDRDRDSDRHRGKRRSRSRDKRERRRSRTPDPSARRRSRSRDRDRDRERRRRRSPRGHDDDDDDDDAAAAAERSGKEIARRRHRDRDRDRDAQPGSDSDGASNANGNKRKRGGSPLRRSGPLPSQDDSFAVSKGEEPEKPKEKPNLRATGLLAAASNSVLQADGTSIVLKYHEPAEARKPPARDQWKLFVFKGADIVDTVDLGLRSCWLVGREAAVVDLVAEHPSISKQHAVVQFRHVEKRNEFGDRVGKVKPYLIDLESANGTVLNGEKIADSRYYELRDKDMIQLGHSTREYVLMLAPKD